MPELHPAEVLATAASGRSMRSAFRGHVRRLLNRVLRVALRWRSRPYDTEADVTTLVFAPHPDDEGLGCSGLLLLKRIEGLTVRVIYITDGSGSHAGHPDLPPATLAIRREAEARVAMGIVGVERAALSFLGTRDGSLDHLAPDAAEKLVHQISSVLTAARPDEIILPCRRDGSSEHDATFGLVMGALQQAGQHPRILEFPVWSWWNPMLLLRPLFTSRVVWRVKFRGYESIKRQALAAYTSQTEPMPPWPAPVLSRDFISFFSTDEEYFFEM